MQRMIPLSLRALRGAVVIASLPMASIAAQPRATAPESLRAAVTHYRAAHEPQILREFADLLAIPTLASDSAGIRRNAAAIVAMMTRRGIATRLLESPSGG